MTRTQRWILIVLGVATLGVLAAAGWLLWSPDQAPPAVPTIPLATVPPNPLLLTREPLCQDVLSQAWPDQEGKVDVSLDATTATLEIRLDVSLPDDEVPAGPIWSAFEVVLDGQAAGCAGYSTVVVLVGEYRAEVATNDLLAWQEGSLDDGAFSDRVTLTR